MKRILALLILVAVGLAVYLALATPLFKSAPEVPNAAAIERKYRALNVAQNFWGESKCIYQDNIPIIYRPMVHNVLARAHYLIYPDGYFRQCWIVVNSNRVLDWPHFCAMITHEYGHLDGKRHSANPYSVMYPVLTLKNIPRVCFSTSSSAGTV